MRIYTIERTNGDKATTVNMREAIRRAGLMLGVSRVYRGAEYMTDRPGINDEREPCTALDIWTSRADATRQTNASAPIVISWAD